MAVNIGLSSAYCSDVSFIALIPVLLGDLNFSTKEIASMMTLFFACDVGARVLFSIMSAFYRVRNKYVYLFGTVFSVIFRIGKSASKFSILLFDQQYTGWQLIANIAVLNIMAELYNMYTSVLTSMLTIQGKEKLFILHFFVTSYKSFMLLNWIIAALYICFMRILEPLYKNHEPKSVSTSKDVMESTVFYNNIFNVIN